MFGMDVLGNAQVVPEPELAEAAAGFGASNVAQPAGTFQPMTVVGSRDMRVTQAATNFVRSPIPNWLRITYMVMSPIGAIVGAYHGYKRNESVGWAIGWALLGSIAPIIVVPVAFAQGIGEKKSHTANRAPHRRMFRRKNRAPHHRRPFTTE